MRERARTHWLIDSALFSGFLLCFLASLTGHRLHQWLGLGVGLLAGIHLLTHWEWMAVATLRLRDGGSRHLRVWYAMNAAMLAGFGAILVTGLAIGTWFAFPLPNYSGWKSVHVLASVGTLLLAVLKIGLHWRWLVAVWKRRVVPAMTSAPDAFTAPAAPAVCAVGRRDFLKLMGGVGGAAALALRSALEGVAGALTNETFFAELAPEPVAQRLPRSATGKRGTAGRQPGNVAAAAPPAGRPTPPSKWGRPQTAPTTSSTGRRRLRCRGRCFSPTPCPRFVDANGNGLCDLAEYL